MNPLIIGFGARARTGKDFATNVSLDLCRKLNIRGTRRAFADALKRELEAEIHRDYAIDVYTNDNKQKNIIRPRLVEHGMAQRAKEPFYWVDRLWKEFERNEIEECSFGRKPTEVLFVPDVRFENEVKFIKGMGGTFINIKLAESVPGWDQYTNDEERENAPKCDALADYTVINRLDESFAPVVVGIVAGLLTSIDFDFWKSILADSASLLYPGNAKHSH